MLWLPIGLALAMALLALRGEALRRRYFARPEPADFEKPPVTVIVPVKGFDEGLAQNLNALATQDYPDYELIVAARSAEDVPAGVVPRKARVVTAGEGDPDTGEKIRNLLAAIDASSPRSQVFAFADSDGLPSKSWLRSLIFALQQPGAGAATGYRWHLANNTFWPTVRSAWNAVIAGGFGPGDMRFCWGGATAIRRETFESARVREYWRGAVSDDYRLSEAIHDAGMKIVFAPGALVPAVDGTGIREFMGWIVRQMRITRFYAPKLWALATFAHVVYCGAMVAAVLAGPVGFVLLAAQLTLGGLKAWRRATSFAVLAPAYSFHPWQHALLQPFVTWLWLLACIGAAFSPTIRWRGNTHRLRTLPKP